MKRASGRFVATLACAAFLLQALVPSFAWALAASRGALSPAQAQYAIALPGAVCSAHEPDSLVQSDPTDQPHGPEAPAPLPAAAHCPLCLLSSGGDAPALTPVAPGLVATGANDRPMAGIDRTTLPVPVRRMPAARAPPGG